MGTEKLIERLRASCLTTQGTDAISSLPYDAADALEASTRREREMREALERIRAFDDGERMADEFWDEIMEIARTTLSQEGL